MYDMKKLYGCCPGQKLRVKTRKNTILGYFGEVSGDLSSLTILGPIKLNGEKLGKFTTIQKEDVEDIIIENGNPSTSSLDSTVSSLEQNLFEPIINDAQKRQIERMAESAVYINQPDESYHNAIREIQADLFGIIGLYAENSEYGR